MDFADTPAEAAFRAELRGWLATTLAALGPEPADGDAVMDWWRRWQGELHAAGYAGIGWPTEYGGRGAGVVEQAIFYEECDRAGAPPRLNVIGEGMTGPTIIDFGTDAQKERFLQPILAGRELWCQLFSEPGAGSDLASLQTRASRDGDGWRIEGAKVWTSRAHLADHGILLARTGGGERHRGITYFLLPMRSDGVEVRPLRHMLGEAEFNEVLLDGVFVDDGLRIGPVDGGWKVAMATLGYERTAIATGRVNTRKAIEDLIGLIREHAPLGADPVVRQRVADLYSRVMLQRLTGQRIISGMAAGAPGPEASTAKLFTAPLVEQIADYAVSLDGLAGQEETPSPWLRLAYQARGTSIAGGTTFVQRNIVAERSLGLPRS
jgi:alkylation response protein AidB-like acyl-CoA dehydrogenase